MFRLEKTAGRGWVLILAGSFAAIAQAAIEVRADDGFAGGSITGTTEPANVVKSVAAIDRNNRKKYQGKIDRRTGRFTIDGLAVDATYDCAITFNRATLEGVNLAVPPSDYEEEQPLSQEDVETIAAKIRRLNKFEDLVEIKTIQGNIQHAAILLSKLRARPFYGSKPGEVIWRAELWHFERPEETWVTVQGELSIVLHRERIRQSDYAKKSLTFDPALGGIKLTSQQPKMDLGNVKPPLGKPGIHFRNAETETARSQETREGLVR